MAEDQFQEAEKATSDSPTETLPVAHISSAICASDVNLLVGEKSNKNALK
jgi:hypothetical protein